MQFRNRFLCILLCLCFTISDGTWAKTASNKESVEKKLLKALSASVTDSERQSALLQLFNYYKDSKLTPVSLSYLAKLVDLQKKTGDNQGLSLSYEEGGKIYRDQRDYLTALEYFFQAVEYSKKSRSEMRSGHLYLQIAQVFRVLNRMELAQKYVKMALDFLEPGLNKKGNEELKVLALNALSTLYYETGNYAEALKFIDMSLQEEKQQNRYICGVSSLHRKALILLKFEKDNFFPAALLRQSEISSLLKNAADLGIEQKEYRHLLPVITDYVEQLIESHFFPQAETYLNKIEDIYAPYYPYYFFFYYLKAIFYEEQGKMGTALEFYRQAAELMENYFSGLNLRDSLTIQEKTGTVYSRILRFYLEMYERTKAPVFIKKALFFSEIKNTYIYDTWKAGKKLSDRFLAEKEKIEHEVLEKNGEYLRLIKNPQNFVQIRNAERSLKSLKKELEEMNEFILESPLKSRKYSFDELDLRSIREKLGPNRIILKYSILKDCVLVFRIDETSLTYSKLKGSPVEIIGEVKRLIEPLLEFSKGRVDLLRVHFNLQIAHRLYNILLKNYTRQGKKIDELIIIPDRELFQLPFEALVTRVKRTETPNHDNTLFSEYSSADYVIQKYPVSYALSMFHLLQNLRPGNDSKALLSAFGCPIIKKKNTGIFKPVPSIKKEIAAIIKVLGPTSTREFCEEEFTKKNIETYAPLSRIIHIATHFINNTSYPQYSALLLSSTKKTDTLLYAHEISHLKLTAELVVLSACESSESHLWGIQGLRGMGASFRKSGVESLVAGMWPVDEYSSRLMPIFYQIYCNELKLSKEKIPLALQKAKLKFMKEITGLGKELKMSFSHPFLWANFILYHFRL